MNCLQVNMAYRHTHPFLFQRAKGVFVNQQRTKYVSLEWRKFANHDFRLSINLIMLYNCDDTG